jgi:hypothetical protein
MSCTEPTSVRARKRVRSLPALPAAQRRGRVWEPSQGSHYKRPSPPDFSASEPARCGVTVGNPMVVNNAG